MPDLALGASLESPNDISFGLVFLCVTYVQLSTCISANVSANLQDVCIIHSYSVSGGQPACENLLWINRNPRAKGRKRGGERRSGITADVRHTPC